MRTGNDLQMYNKHCKYLALPGKYQLHANIVYLLNIKVVVLKNSYVLLNLIKMTDKKS